MKLLLLSLLLVGSCTAAAQRRPTARELDELQDSVWRRLDALRSHAPAADAGCASLSVQTGMPAGNHGISKTDKTTAHALRTPETDEARKIAEAPLVSETDLTGMTAQTLCVSGNGHTGTVAGVLCISEAKEALAVTEAVYASEVDNAKGVVVVHLIRADSAMKARFRRYVHDTPLIRLEGFDPDTTPCPPAPEGTPPPEGLTMRAQYALYPADTDRIRLTIRCRGDSSVYFGTDYSVCRFQNGRWETLPIANVWNSLLIAIGRPEFPAPVDASQIDVYNFTARLAPRVYPAVYARYRICKNVYMENPRRDYLLTADFTVTPFVPFTRFWEQDVNNK